MLCESVCIVVCVYRTSLCASLGDMNLLISIECVGVHEESGGLTSVGAHRREEGV